jgi:hypothetical protein
MLQLRPTCEHCNTTLPPDSPEARICSFECTFCANCVDEVLFNVCPNCGGGFERRPVRPRQNLHAGNDLAHHPAETHVRHRPLDPAAHATFAYTIRSTPPERR